MGMTNQLTIGSQFNFTCEIISNVITSHCDIMVVITNICYRYSMPILDFK